MTLKGPYETNITVYVTDGEREGEIEISLSMGTPPTQNDIDGCMKKAESAATTNGMRLMNKSEFFHAMLRKRTGSNERFAVPGGETW